MRHIKRRQKLGQGMTEYIIILALIAVTSIAVVRIFGDSIKYQMAESISAFLGEKKSAVARPEVTKTSTKKRNMRDFARSND